MQWVVFGILLCWIRLGAGGVEVGERVREEDQLSPEAECLPGSEWDSNCNNCWCLQTGTAQCVRRSDCDTSITALPIHCKPQTTFKRSCNTCTCLESGLGLCTLHQCREPASTTNLAIPVGKVCAPGTSWRSRCNDCNCSPDGQPHCTEKPCSGQDTEREKQCKPGSTWKNDCNTCWCTPEGLVLCTKIGCVAPTVDLHFNDDPIPENKNANRTQLADLRIIQRDCRPNEVFELDCNMCRCNPDGKSFSCTRRACLSEDDDKRITLSRSRHARGAPQEPTKTCQPGHEFRVDCNKCLCDNEGLDFSCTRIDCTALNKNNNAGTRTKRDTTEQLATECTAGSVFEVGCNVCRCTQDGQHAVCTVKRCEQPKEKDDNEVSQNVGDPSFRCNPGEQFKRDCKDCTCSADGRSVFCTLRLCDENLTPNI